MSDAEILTNETQSDAHASKEKSAQKNKNQPFPVSDGLDAPGATEQETQTQRGEKQTYMYMGPNVPGGVVHTGSIYKDALPEHLNELFEKIPEIKELFVEVKNVPQFKTKMNIKGTEEWRLHQTVSLAIKGKVN